MIFHAIAVYSTNYFLFQKRVHRCYGIAPLATVTFVDLNLFHGNISFGKQSTLNSTVIKIIQLRQE